MDADHGIRIASWNEHNRHDYEIASYKLFQIASWNHSFNTKVRIPALGWCNPKADAQALNPVLFLFTFLDSNHGMDVWTYRRGTILSQAQTLLTMEIISR